MTRVFLCILWLSTLPLAAQSWLERPGDEALTGEVLRAELIRAPLVFFDNGQSRFSAGGAYSYTYFEGNTAFGSYVITDDGQVCILFRNGFARCDRYVRNAGRLVMLTQSGERFPIR